MSLKQYNHLLCADDSMSLMSLLAEIPEWVNDENGRDESGTGFFDSSGAYKVSTLIYFIVDHAFVQKVRLENLNILGI